MKMLLYSLLLIGVFGSLHAMDEDVAQQTCWSKDLLIACATNKAIYDAAESKLKRIALELTQLTERKDLGKFRARSEKTSILSPTCIIANQLNDTAHSFPFLARHSQVHPSYGECYAGDIKECQRFIDDLRARSDKVCASQFTKRCQ